MLLTTDEGLWAGCKSAHQHEGMPAATNGSWQTGNGRSALSVDTLRGTGRGEATATVCLCAATAESQPDGSICKGRPGC